MPTALALLLTLATTPAPMRLQVDASEVTRRILHARLTLRTPAGKVTLVYPRWIPGEHGPTGPVAGLAGLRATAGGRPVPWRRDPDDMFAFHLDVPAGSPELEVAFDFVLATAAAGFTWGASSSARLAILNWNQVLLYPRGARAAATMVAPTLTLPEGWKLGTALARARAQGDTVEFRPITLETLVDSPVLMGANLRAVDLGGPVPHTLHVAADGAAALAAPEETLAGLRRLVGEAGALFGARPYRQYHFLLALSDHVAHFGLEHHESSDNRQRERTLVDPEPRLVGAGLLPHEFAHAWNGKHRRPAGLITPDFQRPLRTELLWVYEGLTAYLGEVLTARSGLRTAEQAREALALSAAALDVAPGRTWRPLADTAVAAQITYGSPREWRAWRRGVDFYPEAQLIWLEADVLIRAKSGGRRSLDDFCRAFHGGAGGQPSVKPYVYDDVIRALERIAAHDWRRFFADRLTAPTTRAPLGGLETAGWRLVYRPEPTSFQRAVDAAGKTIDLSWSLGMLLRDDGAVADVIPGTPAAKAGVGPGMRVYAVGGRRFSPQVILDAVRATRAAPELELLVENADHVRAHRLTWAGGARYPALERIADRPDLLGAILASATK